MPIIVFYCDSCGEPFTDKQVLDHVVAQFREHTADIWYSKTAEQLMGDGFNCKKCASTSFRKETDILDVWFDSGSSHLAVLTPENNLPWPADMYLEGGDQYRGWFHSSLLVGVGLLGRSPYRECATHGWTLDKDGKAMSKSVGNIIEPEEIIKKYGADLLRLWVASVDFMEDVRASDLILTRLAEAYRNLRNRFRYILSNLSDFDPARDAISGRDLQPIDRWIVLRTEELVRKCLAWYRNYDFHKVYRAVYDFFEVDLSALYFDVSKDRLYTAGPGSPERRSAQTALHRLSLSLTRLLAPILSYTCEEVWRYAKPLDGAPESIHMDYFPVPEELTEGITAEQRAEAGDWGLLVPIRDRVLKALDDAREAKVIGKSLDAAVFLQASGQTLDLLTKHGADLPTWFIVSQADIQPGAAADLLVRVERARGDKCERCWKYTLDVGSNPEFPTVCAACAAVVPEFLN